MPIGVEILINAAYFIFLFSLVVRDVLWLRIIMSVATLLVIVYATLIDRTSILVWNCVFMGINVVQIVRILIERRPITLPPHLEEIFSDCFANRSRRDFLNFWGFGREVELDNEQVCTEGREPGRMFYITDGEAEVSRKGEVIATRERLNFIAELSFFTGKPASADVTVRGKAMVWTRDKLEDLKKIKPDLVQALRESIGHSVCQKLVGGTS